MRQGRLTSQNRPKITRSLMLVNRVLHPNKLTWQWEKQPVESMYISASDFPASHVSFLEGTWSRSSQDTDTWLNNHGDPKSPIPGGNVGPLPFMAELYGWTKCGMILTTWPSPGMFLQVHVIKRQVRGRAMAPNMQQGAGPIHLSPQKKIRRNPWN